jgi:hypothetical protein
MAESGPKRAVDKRFASYLSAKEKTQEASGPTLDDGIAEWLSFLSMLLSMVGMLSRNPIFPWIAIFASCVAFAHVRRDQDFKQVSLLAVYLIH